MYRYGMFAALAFGAVALMSGTTSAGVATGALQVKPSASVVQQVGHRHRHCRRRCHWVGPVKICKRRCHWN
jgi:Mn2+/Fe2+ NRAMP family transporter